MTQKYYIYLPEEIESLENAIDDAEFRIWQNEQKYPLDLVENLIEWVEECTFDNLQNWSSQEIDDLAEKLDDLGIWISKVVNPCAERKMWQDTLKPLIKQGRTALIVSAVVRARNNNNWKKVIDIFQRARAQLEVENTEIDYSPN